MNWRRIIAAGTVAGMIAITGCSTSLPETNQGNRNGQRVVDAANRRPDSYRATRNRGVYNGTGRITRGLNRGMNRINNTNRDHTINRSLNIGRPDARMGTTYRAPGMNYGRNHALDGRGFDTGVTATDSAIVNNRTRRVESTNRTALPRIDHNRANAGKMAGDVTQRNATTTRSTTRKSTTPAVTRNTAAKPARSTAVKPAATHNKTTKTNVTRNTAPKTTTRNKSVKPAATHTAPKANVTRNATNTVPKTATTRSTAPKAKTTRNTITNNTHNTSVRSNHANPYTINHQVTNQASRYGMNLYQNRAARRNQAYNRVNVSRTGGVRKRYNELAPKNVNKQ